uniref:Glycine N-acyltransferase-like protein n=1 Tax=Caenorhabditis japonica TaxID=281687 RepID=A0A8R1HNL8_CAEJA
MFFHKLSIQQLADLIPFFRSLPKFALFENAAKFEVERKLPNHPCDFYSLKSKNAIYFYCFRHNRLPDNNRPILMIGNEGKVNDDDVIEGLSEIKSVEPDMEKVCLLLAVSDLATPARKFLKSHFNLIESGHNPCYNFYVPPTVYPQILEKTNQSNHLPPNFSIGSTRITDAEIVNSTWKFATPEDILQQKEKIVRLPTACIFHNDQPVAFEMVGLHGQLSHQYTFPEFRNKGFGSIIENSIVAKCINNEICPIKSVELSNSSVLKRSQEHPLWKVVSSDNDVALIFDYVVFK